MRLGFFTMPIHPLDKDWRQSLREDREAFRETVGDFGTLLYAGKDWAEPKLARRSMVLMAEKVMPAVNAAIGGGKSQAAE
jgi:hypothetical protein